MKLILLVNSDDTWQLSKIVRGPCGNFFVPVFFQSLNGNKFTHIKSSILVFYYDSSKCVVSFSVYAFVSYQFEKKFDIIVSISWFFSSYFISMTHYTWTNKQSYSSLIFARIKEKIMNLWKILFQRKAVVDNERISLELPLFARIHYSLLEKKTSSKATTCL